MGGLIGAKEPLANRDGYRLAVSYRGQANEDTWEMTLIICDDTALFLLLVGSHIISNQCLCGGHGNDYQRLYLSAMVSMVVSRGPWCLGLGMEHI